MSYVDKNILGPLAHISIGVGTSKLLQKLKAKKTKTKKVVWYKGTMLEAFLQIRGGRLVSTREVSMGFTNPGIPNAVRVQCLSALT